MANEIVRDIVIERIRNKDHPSIYFDVVRTVALATSSVNEKYQRDLYIYKNASLAVDPGDVSEVITVRNEEELKDARRKFAEDHAERQIAIAKCYKIDDLYFFAIIAYRIERNTGGELRDDLTMTGDVLVADCIPAETADIGDEFEFRTQSELKDAIKAFKDAHP